MNPIPLLLLHHRYTSDDQQIWKEAISRGWRTERVMNVEADVKRKTEDASGIVRYCGNMLQMAAIGEFLPIRFVPIYPNNLASELLRPFVRRKIELIQSKNIKQPLEEETFYKSDGIKWIESRIYKVGESFVCKPDDWLYKQTIVKFTKEMRCFVIDGEIVTASQYRNENGEFDCVEIVDVPREVKEMAMIIFSSCLWPRGVVFDFALDLNGNFFFLEPNEAFASGLYACNAARCFDTILLSQTDK